MPEHGQPAWAQGSCRQQTHCRQTCCGLGGQWWAVKRPLACCRMLAVVCVCVCVHMLCWQASVAKVLLLFASCKSNVCMCMYVYVCVLLGLHTRAWQSAVGGSSARDGAILAD